MFSFISCIVCLVLFADVLPFVFLCNLLAYAYRCRCRCVSLTLTLTSNVIPFHVPISLFSFCHSSAWECVRVCTLSRTFGFGIKFITSEIVFCFTHQYQIYTLLDIEIENRNRVWFPLFCCALTRARSRVCLCCVMWCDAFAISFLFHLQNLFIAYFILVMSGPFNKR